MSLRTSANRYAKALFDVAIEEKADLATVDGDLKAVVDMMRASPDLAEAAGRTSVPDAARRALIGTVAASMGLTQPVTKLLVLLADHRKLNRLPDLSAAFHERLLAHENVVRADVTSASPLSADKAKALGDSLAKATGKKIDLSVSVDPDLLGGVVARIGSTIYDGSVKTQLARMRRELVEK